MKYIKASEILPDGLVNVIQEYAEGCLIYIPNKPGTRRGWGSFTNTRELLQNRNESIIRDYLSGLTVKRIASKYYLAESTVKKIVYAK